MKNYKQTIINKINDLYLLIDERPENAGTYKVQINRLLHQLYITWFSLSKREHFRNI